MKIDTQFASYFIEVNLLGKKDLHDVVRESLNAAALNMKKKSIPSEAKNKFIVRRANYFTALTSVNYSKRGQASDLNGLFSEVGFLDKPQTQNMEVQEWGGVVNRPVTPLNASRISNSYNRRVAKGNIFRNMDKLPVQSKTFGKTKKQRFAIMLANARNNGLNFVYADEFNGIYKIKGDSVKLMYYAEKSRKIRLERKGLMNDSMELSKHLIYELFIKEAQKKIAYRASKVKF